MQLIQEADTRDPMQGSFDMRLAALMKRYRCKIKGCMGYQSHCRSHPELNKHMPVVPAHVKAWQTEIDKVDDVATPEEPPRTVRKSIQTAYSKRKGKKKAAAAPESTGNPMIDYMVFQQAQDKREKRERRRRQDEREERELWLKQQRYEYEGRGRSLPKQGPPSSRRKRAYKAAAVPTKASKRPDPAPPLCNGVRSWRLPIQGDFLAHPLCACLLFFILLGYLPCTGIMEGWFNAEYFLHWIVNQLMPHCNAFPAPRSVIIMENASVHINARIFN